MYRYHPEEKIAALPEDQVFVFGSDLAGEHRGRAAQTALQKFGALYGVGRGWSGQSFAIPTRNAHNQNMPISQIAHYIDDFKTYTLNHPKQTYFVTAVGCGTTGFAISEIAPLFQGISNNVILPQRFAAYLTD